MTATERSSLLEEKGEDLGEDESLDLRLGEKESSTEDVSTSERMRLTKHLPEIGAAAFLVRDAVLLEVENPAEGAYDPYSDPSQKIRNDISTVCRRLCAYRPLLGSMHAISWGLVLLTFFEPPHWCRLEDDDADAIGCADLFQLQGAPAGSDLSSDDIDFLYPSWGATLITSSASNTIESVGVALLSFFILMRIGRDGMSMKRYMRPSHVQRSRLVQLLVLVSLVVGLLSGQTIHHPYARLAFLLSLSAATQQKLKVLVNLLPDIFNILAILFVLMIFYAWFGTVMFVGSDEGSMHFSSFIESLWTLWICVTTANYPDVMMPAYNSNRWSCLYFVSFMIVSFFFLMNLILAEVFEEYQQVFDQEKHDRIEDSKKDLRKAFALLDPNESGGISKKTIMGLFYILNVDFPEFRTLSPDHTNLLFAILDRDGSSAITEEEFMDFGSVLLLDFVKASEYETFMETRFPRLFISDRYQAFCRVVQSSWFEYGVDAVLVLNAIVIGIQSYPELSGQEVDLDPKFWDGSIDTIWEKVETIFTVIYAMEVIVKVLVMGRKRYFESIKNMFDFGITMLAVVSSVYVYYPNDYNDSRLVRMIVMIRALRLFRLVLAMKRFQLIGSISVKILPAASSVFMLLFSLAYFFAVLGVQLYGGQITRDPNNPLSDLILDTDFADNDYWANNFNDMLSAFNVLFNLLVVNNWTECEVGFEATTQSRWVRLFFFSFHICGVVLVNNLFIAFVVNAFFQELAVSREKIDAEIVGTGEAILKNRAAFFEASEVTGTKTPLSGGYIARVRHSASTVSDGHEQDRLRRLFSQTSSEASM